MPLRVIWVVYVSVVCSGMIRSCSKASPTKLPQPEQNLTTLSDVPTNLTKSPDLKPKIVANQGSVPLRYYELRVIPMQFRLPMVFYSSQKFFGRGMEAAASENVFGYRRERREDFLSKAALDKCLHYYPKYYCYAPYDDVP